MLMEKLESNQTDPTSIGAMPRAQIFVFGAALMCAAFAGSLMTQAPCPGIGTFATGLVAPSKIIQSPRGNFIVAEAGPQVPNHGRVSIVDRQGNRRTLLDGLPAARTFVGDF